MTTNPYAPPLAAVADLAGDGRPAFRRSRLVVVVGVNAALFGFVTLALRVFYEVNPPSKQTASVAGTLIVALLGVLAIVAAMGIIRYRRWAAIVWSVMSGLILAVALMVAPKQSSVEFVLLGLLAAQFGGSILGLWAVLRRRAMRASTSLNDQ